MRAKASICSSATSTIAGSGIWAAARQITCAASNEISPAIKAFPVAASARSARPVATSSPARPADRPQPCRKNAAVEEYPASAAPSTASRAAAKRASSPWARSMNPARSRTWPSSSTAFVAPGPRAARPASTSSRAVIPGEHIIESSHEILTFFGNRIDNVRSEIERTPRAWCPDDHGISGRMNAGFASGWCARAAAPPRSRSQYHSPNAITFVSQITPPVASSPVALLAKILLLVRTSLTRRAAAYKFANAMQAMTMPVTTRSHVRCRSMRPGSPMIKAASSATSTARTIHAGCTRYFSGRPTCKPAVAAETAEVRKPTRGPRPIFVPGRAGRRSGAAVRRCPEARGHPASAP